MPSSLPPTQRRHQRPDSLDVPLEDPVLLEEVELVSTLMVAATEAEQPLDQRAIDQLLGVRR